MSIENLHRLVDLLDLKILGGDRFEALNSTELTPTKLFGGLTAAQALRAAQLTVAPGFRVHSLHVAFVRGGPPDIPLTLVVDRSRDGRSIASRLVSVVQSGEVICTLTASFHIDEPAEVHEAAMPRIVGPEGGAWAPPPDRDFGPQTAFEHLGQTEQSADGTCRRYWTRPVGPVADDPELHACLFTVLTDFWAMLPAVVAIGGEVDGSWMTVSLDHSIWFHRAIPLNDWLLVEQRSVATVNSRGLSMGSVFAPDGSTVATVAQEALIRRLRSPAADDGRVKANLA